MSQPIKTEVQLYETKFKISLSSTMYGLECILVFDFMDVYNLKKTKKNNMFSIAYCMNSKRVVLLG